MSAGVIVLLSGGLDSATVLAMAGHEGYRLHAMTFDYGQRHAWEIQAARRLAERHAVVHHAVVNIDLRQFGGSALTDQLEVPKHRQVQEIGDGIPLTYVPARNTVFLSLALAWAEVLGIQDIMIGVNAVDYSGYPDCRAEFIAAFERMANLATRAAVEGQTMRIQTPLIAMSKAEIIRTGLELGVDYGLTTSCYDPVGEGLACGHCDACLLRLRGFEQNGEVDPARYVVPRSSNP